MSGAEALPTHKDIKVKLTPRASRNEVLGREGDYYRVKVTAPPVEGMANKALVALLSETLKTAKRDIEIIAGKNSRLKTVRIQGLSEAKIAKALEAQK
jgi:uncharacterized protein (TIGR00251 family)